MYRMPNMNNILQCCNNNTVKYNKLVTGGNDPTITKAMKYSQTARQNARTTCNTSSLDSSFTIGMGMGIYSIQRFTVQKSVYTNNCICKKL